MAGNPVVSLSWCRAGEVIGPLDARDVQCEGLIPLLAAVGARPGVLCVSAPGADRLLIAPVGDGDAEAVGPAGLVDAEEPRLVSGKPKHLLGALPVAVVSVSA